MEETTPQIEQNAGLDSAPIVPSLPELQSASDPLALLKTPTPTIAPPVITPPIPSGVPAGFNTNRQLQGDYETGPTPGAKASNMQKSGGTLDFVNAAASYMQDDNTVKDRYKYGRTYSYGSGYKNMNFDRYYKKSEFKDLGFSPYRDNEKVYNENTSWWSDFNRMRGEWAGLAWTGFKSVWGDEEEANEAMEKAMAIGSSSRGGFGGWVTNFGINSAYTVGIIGELAVEDVGLALMEGLSGGLATPVVGAELVKQGWTFKRLAEAWKGTYDFMKALRSAEKAKELFSAAKAGEKLKDFANWVTPFRETREWTSNLAQGINGVDKMGNLAKVSRTFGNFYRDVRELNLAHSEAKLEGAGASSEYHDKLLDEFYAKNGRMPDPGAESDAIFEKAQSVKAAVTLANDYTIYLTNKLVFDNFFRGGFNPSKAVANTFLESTGRALERTAAADFKVGTTAAYQAAEETAKKKIVNALFRSEYVPWSRRYFLGNLSEALQENSQEVIRIAALDYYDRIHSDPTQVGTYSAYDAIGKGIGEQFSPQGMDTFLQGYLMGALIQGGGGFIKKIKSKIGEGASGIAYHASQGKYGTQYGTQAQEEEAAKTRAEELENQRLNSVNFILDNALIYGGNKADVASAIKNIYEEKENAENRGDQYNSRNLQNEAQVNHFHSLARSNSMALISTHVDDMLTLDDKALEEAYNNADSATNIRSKLNTLKDRAEGYQRKYDKYNRERPNRYNPWRFDKEKYPELYEEEMNRYLAHEQIMADTLFSTEVHEDIARRMATIGTELMGEGDMGTLFNVKSNGSVIGNALGSDISILADSELRKSEMLNMATRIAVLKQGTKEQVREAGLLQKQLSMLSEWNGMADTLIRELNSETRAAVSEEEKTARRQRTNLYPGTTVRDNDTGEILTVFKHIVGTSLDKSYYRKPGTLLKDANGNTVRYDANKHTKVKDAPGTPSRFREVEGEGSTFATEKLYELFDKYVKFVAKAKNGYVFSDKQNDAFAKIKDFIRLSVEERKIVNTINMLSDPEMFNRYFNWQSEIQKIARAGKAMAINRAFEKFKQMAEKNKMLSDLFDIGVFVMPEDVKKLKAFELPRFYDAATRTILEEDSPKYEQAVKILEEYAAKQGKSIVRPVVEEEAQVTEEEAAVKPEEETKEEEKEIVFTRDASIEDLKNDHPVLLKKLIPAYRDWYRETYENETTATDAEITDSEDFMDFVKTTSKAATIIDDYNQGREAVVKPTTKKETIKEPESKLDPISDLIYEEFQSTGRVSPFVLEKIAARIVDKTPLSEREKEIVAAKEEDINKYKAKIEEERSKAAVPTMITKAMRNELIQDLRYTKEQVNKMKPEEAQKILQEGIINPEIAKMEEEAKDDLVAKLARVENAQDLEQWKKDAAEFRLAPISQREAFEKRHGVEFNGDYVREQVENKIIELRDNLDIDTLTPNTSVKLLNGRIMVVKSNDGNSITLGDPMNNPDVEPVTVPKEEIQNVILMKNGEFVDTAEEVELTPEEMDDAKKEVDEARSQLDDKKLNDIIDEASAVDPDKAKQNAIDKLKSCKR